MKMSNVMQTLTMLAVLGSFTMANFNYPGAVALWTTGGESIGLLIAFGVGLKMAQRATERYIDKKYGTVQTTSEGG